MSADARPSARPVSRHAGGWRMISPPLAAIALLSAAALGYEILLMRLFSIILWHHFAYMMISVAMLGYGAGGTFVALVATTPSGALQWIGALGLAAAAVAGFRSRGEPRWLPAAVLGVALLLPFGLPADWTRLRPSEYKDLSQTLSISGTKVVAERSSPIGLVDVV